MNLVRSIPLAAVALLSCSGRNPDFPEVEGWIQEGEVSTYDVDTLWEYIDGAAELFIDYGVLTCRTTDLSSGDVTVTVDLYDMDIPLNAFGIFKLESSGRGESLPDAVEAAVSPPYQALMVKGATYVKVNAVEGELTETVGRALLEGMAHALPGQTAYPEELELLPQDGKVAGSEGYQVSGFLGLTELNNCIYAEYTVEGEENWLGFIMRLPPGSSSPWTGLTGRWKSTQLNGLTVLYSEIPYRGMVGIVQTEQGIMGVSGAADRGEMLHRLDNFVLWLK